jgi:hypothetical protein
MSNKYLRLASVLFAVTTLTACANKPYEPVPEGYTGPVAEVSDTIDNENGTSAYMYVVYQVDYKPVVNSIAASLNKSYGNGAMLTSELVSRKVPIEQIALSVMAKKVYASPVGSWVSENPVEVKDKFTFTPQAGHSYSVKGVLGMEQSIVQLVDEIDGAIIAESKATASN